MENPRALQLFGYESYALPDGTSKADHLRCSQAGLGGETEERVVSPAGGRRDRGRQAAR
jgi:hypothetical protein